MNLPSNDFFRHVQLYQPQNLAFIQAQLSYIRQYEGFSFEYELVTTDENNILSYCITGRIKVDYKMNTFNIPISITLSSRDYPTKPPILRVQKIKDIIFREDNPYLDFTTGQILLPLLKQWNASIPFITILDELVQCFTAFFPIEKVPTAFISLIDSKNIQVLYEKGSGSFARVYKAIWGNHIVALKVLRREILSTTGDLSKQEHYFRDMMNRLTREVTIMSTIDHENIIKCYGITNYEDSPALILEYASNNLRHLLDNIKYLLVPNVQKHILLQIAKGIAHLHSFKHPIIHRDLKADNIFINQDYVVKIGDFGFARELVNERLSYVGTQSTMAPEILRLEKHYTEKVDVYSFGCVVYEVMTRMEVQRGYPNISRDELLHKISYEGLRPVIPEEVPQPAKELMHDCFQHDPAKRPSMAEIYERILQWSVDTWPDVSV